MAELLEKGIPSLVSGLPKEVRDRLNAVATPVTYRNRETIHQRGDMKPGLSIVKFGAVRMGNYTQDGKFFAVGILQPGHSFGEYTVLTDMPRTHHALAVGETVVNQISKESFHAVAKEHPEVKEALMMMMATRLHVALEFIEDMRTLSLPARVGKVLIGIRSHINDDAQTLVDLTQDELAETLGVTRVSVNQSLKRLEAEGLIERRYRAVFVPDVVKLTDWIAAETQLTPLK